MQPTPPRPRVSYLGPAIPRALGVGLLALGGLGCAHEGCPIPTTAGVPPPQRSAAASGATGAATPPTAAPPHRAPVNGGMTSSYEPAPLAPPPTTQVPPVTPKPTATPTPTATPAPTSTARPPHATGGKPTVVYQPLAPPVKGGKSAQHFPTQSD